MSPRVGVGFLFSTPKWFIGLSSPNFSHNNHTPSIQGSTIDTRAHYYFTTGFSKPITDEVLFKPSLLSRYVEGSRLALDIAANFNFVNQFSFGVSYRWDAAVLEIEGINVTEKNQAGYS